MLRDTHSRTQKVPDTAVSPVAAAIRCRLIEDADLDAVAELLARGFPDRSAGYWRSGLERLRALPAGDYPRYGYVLEDGARLGGVLLTIYTPDLDAPRCNLSSWYVDPDYRHLAMHLDRAATRERKTTYLNISPAEHTRKLIQALGYVSLNEDTVIALPWSSPSRGAKVEAYGARHDEVLSPFEARLARDHLAWGCIALVAGDKLFVFQHKRLPGIAYGAVHVLYCPSPDDLIYLAGPLGRALLKQGVFLWKIDGPAVPKGLIGWHFTGRSARWTKGPNPPHLNNLSYTELAVFGA